MANIRYYNQVFPCGEGQSIHDVLLENGQDIAHSCKMGVCVTCIMQVVDGEAPPESQVGLRYSLVKQGRFLPCVCTPVADIEIADIDQQDLFSPAVVDEIEQFGPDIRRIFMLPATPLYYRAGQFMNLRRKAGPGWIKSGLPVTSYQPE